MYFFTIFLIKKLFIIHLCLDIKTSFLILGIISSITSLDLSPWSPWTFDLPEKELPKSPWNTFPSHSKYLITGCLSKPNSNLRASTADFVALCPRISVAKSPGKKEKQLNIITEKAKTVIIPSPILNKIVLKIGWIPVIFNLLIYSGYVFTVIMKLGQNATLN